MRDPHFGRRHGLSDANDWRAIVRHYGLGVVVEFWWALGPHGSPVSGLNLMPEFRSLQSQEHSKGLRLRLFTPRTA